MNSVFQHIRTFLEQQPVVARGLEKSSSPNILYSQLPKHWRSNKSFQDQFIVVLLTPVPDNTEVSIWAGNDEAPCGEIRNEKARVHRQIAKFNDLRFVGRSGRGRRFHLTIVIHSNPMMVATAKNVIKVTVDGPREARIPKQCSSSSTSSLPSSSSNIKHMEITQHPIIPPILAPQFWPFPVIPGIMPSIFPFQLPTTIGTKRKLESDQENECLNTSSFSTSSPPNASSSSSNNTTLSSNTSLSPSSISLIQQTTPSVKRKRNESTTSSNGSSPTIWRPF
ncbi:unnamed protein product [Caenorhabditis angaria]|uniref:Runt domain-containing protein n=1 Tax=Caenorhabditis angaria TaxID=860376 RepID=A0A9P1MX00_9PELO|nr:unnamed protein product [Caenorhabditis angaria]